MAQVSISHLSKRFGHAPPSLDDISVDIQSGEFVVLVGPSGCGKSTLLRCVAGLERPTAGEIKFDGEPVNHLSPAERGIGMVFQDYALYPHMNVRENLSFGLTIQRLPKPEIVVRVDEAASMLGLEKSSLAKALSAFGRATSTSSDRTSSRQKAQGLSLG